MYPAYSKISKATKDLREASKITQRRECAETLKHLLSDTNLRSKLVHEATTVAHEQNYNRNSGRNGGRGGITIGRNGSGSGKSSSPHAVLVKIYSNAVKAAMHATKLTLDSSIKCKNEDIILPFKIFTSVDKESNAALSAMQKERQGQGQGDGTDRCWWLANDGACEPFTFDNFERYRNTNKNLTYIQSKEIKELLKFCLDGLEDEGICALAEKDLLNMLQILCSRADYVAHFHPSNAMIDILTTVQERVVMRVQEGDLDLDTRSITDAAKAFYNLVHQFTVVLDIDISGFVKSCLALVLDWIRTCCSSGTGAVDSAHVLKWMYGVVVDVLSVYPEQCIVVLEQESYGKDLFRYARRRWLKVKDDDKQALVAYFAAHLYVCEVAGNQQGLFPGDLGSLGTATIDQQKLGQLKEMLLSEHNLEAFSNMSTNSQSARSNDRTIGDQRHKKSKKRRRTGAGTVQERFCPLAKGQRKYLELCARVLRCLQRIHLATSERSTASNKSVDELLVEECVDNASTGLGSDALADEIGIISSSPWVSSVASKSFGHVISSEMKEISSSMDYTSQSPPDSQSVPLSQDSDAYIGVENGELVRRLPMLLAIDGDAKEIDDSKVIVYLQIISACCETFPRGECWSSTNKWYKTSYSPLHPAFGDKLANVVTYCNACSPLDMAAIVYSLSLILSRYGGANASVRVQMWALVCLLKMTEASNICCKYSSNGKLTDELILAWQTVWSCLLQSELRYHSSTSQAEPSSVGEMVLMLLTEIVRGGLIESGSLTDNTQSNQSSYLKKCQGSIWNLPIFSNALDLKVSAPFELASIIIRRSGLVEGCEDSICSRGSDSNMLLTVKTEAEKGRGRRFRLANFCLQFISQSMKMAEAESMRRMSLFCCSLFCALLDTKVTDLTSFSIKAFREFKITDRVFDTSPLCNPKESEDTSNLDLGLLWVDSLVPFWFQSEVDADLPTLAKLRDIPLCPFWSFSDRSWLALNISSKSELNSNPTQTFTNLKDYGLKSLHNILYLASSEDKAASKAHRADISCKTVVTKINLALALCGDTTQRQKSPWNSIENSVDSVFNEVLSNVQNLRHNGDDFAHVFTDLLGVIRLVRSVMSTQSSAKYIKGVLSVKFCTKLYKLCEDIVRPKSKNQMNSKLKSSKSALPKVRAREDLDSDFEGDGDDEESPQSSYHISPFPNSDESESDGFDSEDEKYPRKKRKKSIRGGDENGTNLQSLGEMQSDICCSLSSWVCSAVMLQLHPSIESGSFVANAILWPQDTSRAMDSPFDSEEPHDFLLLLSLLCHCTCFDQHERSGSQSSEDNSPSIMTLCFNVISQCREVCGIASPMHMWGFGVCSDLMSKSSHMSSQDIEQLMSILLPDSTTALRALKNRSGLQCSQLKAATKCFLYGDSNFHQAFDSTFAKMFVMKALKNQHPKIRQAGLGGLAASLTMFPLEVQEKIANDAIAAFPPKPLLGVKPEVMKSFKDWVEDKTVGVDFVEYKTRSWVENRKTLEWDKVLCIGVIARNTSNDDLAVKMICALFMISILPKRRKIAFQTLESIAKTRKYRTIEAMLQKSRFQFFKSWIGDEKALYSLPVTATLPSLVRALTRLQIVDQSEEPSGKMSTNCCSPLVFETAAAEFIFRNAPFIVPFVFITNMEKKDEIEIILSSSVEQISQDSDDKSYFWNLASEVACACTDGDVKRLVRSHFHHIYAQLIPMFLVESAQLEGKDRKSVQEFIGCVSSIFKNLQKHIMNSTPSIVSELLHLGMEKNIFHDRDGNFPPNFFVSSMKYLSQSITDDLNENPLRGLFQSTSISATECILCVKSVLDCASQPKDRFEAWSVINSIVEIVQSDSSEVDEIGFCIITILNVCLNAKNDDGLRFSALGRLKKILADIRKERTDTKEPFTINLYVNKIVSCLIHIHEEYQLDLMAYFRTSWRTKRIQSRMNSSFTSTGDDEQTPIQDSMYLDEDDEIDLAQFITQDFDKQISSDITACIGLTYDILAMILDNAAPYSKVVQQILDPFPESKVAISDLASLEKFDNKCSLFALKNKFHQVRDKTDNVGNSERLKRFLAIVSRFRSTESTNIALERSNHKSVLSFEERSLISALKNLKADIQASATAIVARDIDNNNSILFELGRELFQLCDDKHPEEIQIASIQCIGNLALLSQGTNSQASTFQSMKPRSKRKSVEIDPLSKIFSSAFTILAKRIQVDDIEIATNAKDTAKALMSTKDGLHGWKCTETDSETWRIIAPFDNKNKVRHGKVELPEDFFLKLLGKVHKTKENLKVDNSWCWSDDLWLPDDSLPYTEWITDLVTAIILCCYADCAEEKDSSALPIKGTSDFFPACVSMCARDHQFAATIFPGIIYDLLNTDSSDNYDGCIEKVGRSYMVGGPLSLTNQTLTRCFGRVLDFKETSREKTGKCRGTNEYQQGLHIFIETLNMLRLITEDEFSKIRHLKSLSSIQGRKYSRGGRLPVSEEDYNSTLPEPPPWRGRPYGIVLHLMGTDLSRAYVETKDFAAALYYAEAFADNRLGGSGCIFERLNNLNVVQSSLSGFGIPIEGHNDSRSNLSLSKSDLAIDLYRILDCCFTELHEDEVCTGLEEQTSSLQFERPECFNQGIPQFERVESSTGIISGLMELDARSQLRSKSNSSRDMLATSTGLKQLGLRNASLHYLAGIHASGALRSADDFKMLEEQWAEESWRLLQWDDSTVLIQSQQALQKSQNDVGKSSVGTLDIKDGFHASFRSTILSLLEEDFSTFWVRLRSTRSSLLAEFHRQVGQNAPIVELNRFALRSSSINQLEDIGDAFKDNGHMSASSWIEKHCIMMDFVTKKHDETKFSDFDCAMVAHEVFLKLLHKKYGESSTDLIGNKISSHLWRFCSIARQRGRHDVASSALDRLKYFYKSHDTDLAHTEINNSLLSLRYSFEEAKICHCSGNETSAIQTCKEIMKRLKESPPTMNYAGQHYTLLIETKLQCAEWLIKYPIESNSLIQDDLLAPAASLSKKLLKNNLADQSLVSSTHFALGNFVADLYERIQKRVNSHEWKVLRRAALGRQKQKEKLEKIIASKMKSKEYVRENPGRELINAAGQQRALQKEVDMDTNERNQVEASVFKYLNLAIDAYGVALSRCIHDTHASTQVVFRFISIWFKNSSIDDEEIHEKIMSLLVEIPSYHFVSLIYQIFSRVDSSSDPNARVGDAFQTVLQNLVCKICIEHPYHGLIQLVALSNGNNVEQTRYANEFSADIEKVNVIKQLMKRVKATAPPYVAELLDSYQIVADAYIALAMEATEKFTNKKRLKNIPYSQTSINSRSKWLYKCLSYRGMRKPCVFTAPPHIRAGADYGDGESDPVGSERIKSFGSTFSLTDSGIHRPKIIMCDGTKGGSYKQLVKGDDDIRQDAVMQQVFTTMNVFLRDQKNQSYSNRKLQLLTYSCIPLSPATGVLEWVENTIPLAGYLLHSKGAHTRYYPGEWTNGLCASHMACSPPHLLRPSFDAVCKNFSPAFRFFFLEKFSHSPQLWHKARMSYTRSCAVNSMVGHVLGIGDRHSNNILIHEHTGEVVHIDFGFVFEQGKVQSTPETVPFRLTRDVVDGMGPTGTDGVFTAASRAMTALLRENSSALLTVLSAVVSDPLYKWNINMTTKQTNPQNNNSNNDDDGSTADDDNGARENVDSTTTTIINNSLNIVESQNDAATRAIGRINEKLKGYEEGTSGQQLTIEGQVSLLIKEAKDPNNLCRLYAGWGAWI